MFRLFRGKENITDKNTMTIYDLDGGLHIRDVPLPQNTTNNANVTREKEVAALKPVSTNHERDNTVNIYDFEAGTTLRF